jgi:hypothetical protein
MRSMGQAVDLEGFEALDQDETLDHSVTQGLSCERRGYEIGWRACAPVVPGHRAKTWDVLQTQEVKLGWRNVTSK